jgi:long-chain acyl-CoA synthetase
MLEQDKGQGLQPLDREQAIGKSREGIPLVTTTRPKTMAELTAPGGPFPLVTRTVNGVELQVYDRDPRTLRDAFLATRAHGDQIAVVYADERYTFADQWDIVVALARRLRSDFGVRGGDRVAIAMRNYPEWIFSFWATQLLGAVTVPLNAWLTAPELGALIADSEPVVIIADQDRINRVRAAGEASGAAPLPLIGVRTEGDQDGVTTFDGLGRDAGGAEPPDAEISPDDMATILYTSGTTGRPKGAVGTHLNHTASLLNKLIRAEMGGAARGSNKLVTYPFFHIAGINTMYSATYSGHLMVLMYKWDIGDALGLIERERVTEMAGAPFVIRTFIEAAVKSDRDLSSLNSIGLGGSAAPAQLITDVYEYFDGRVSPRTGFGSTETTSGVVAIGGRTYVERPDSVGTILPGVEMRIVDGDTPVPEGELGEIVFKGPQVVSGYWHAPEASAATFRDGWFHTGDTGRIDQDGYLYILGRIKDIVIRGGENISCGEVEGCLGNHPDVVEVAAYGVPHPTLGEELGVVACLSADSTATADDLRKFVGERLAAFKVPAHVTLSSLPLPRTASGKVIKRELAGFIAGQ